MGLGPRLDLRQSQSLVMTPQMQQAIRLLALSNLEIESFIAEEIERNPLLETGSAEGDELASPDAVEATAASEVEIVNLIGESGGTDSPLDMNPDSEDFHQDSASDATLGLDGGLGVSSSGEGGGEFDQENVSGGEVSLYDHLSRQAGARLSGPDLLIALQIIEELEETGYFCGSLKGIAERLAVPVADVERVLGIVQSFDPSGIAARSLSECLKIQAREADRYDPAMARLIDNLDYLAKGNLSALKRICRVDDEDLGDMIRELRAYDPKPGCRFLSADQVNAVTPDVFVASKGKGWAVELNSATLPRLLLNRSYYQELSSGPQDRRSKAWLGECLASANFLMKALDQRARTIVKVSSEIVKQQEAFFRQGVAHLRPLTLRAVAEAIGMHESTVSRVTSNKYLSCERGMFELKYFFTSGIQNDAGDGVSAEAVKSHIKTMISAEDPRRTLSDDQLVDQLRAKGFDIARRTVAKYREAMGIGSSVQRRRQNAIGG